MSQCVVREAECRGRNPLVPRPDAAPARLLRHNVRSAMPGTDVLRPRLRRRATMRCPVPSRAGDFWDNSNAREDAVEISKFKELFLAELQELLSAEQQLSDVLLRMAGAASHPALKRALIH